MPPKKKRSINTGVRTFLRANRIATFSDALSAAEPRPDETAASEVKKNYAQRLSEACAVLIANSLREAFPQILPNPDGTGQESAARTGKGIKKLDVNYSTPELGLGLGVSIKTLNFRDPQSRRYTKNPTRLDNELRAEAMDYHVRQPYAVLIGVVLIPADACEDGDPNRPKQSRSSFAQIVNVLRHRATRDGPRDEDQLFEKLYIGLYRHLGESRGTVEFFDVDNMPPQFGTPTKLLSVDELVVEIVEVYDGRNAVKPAWETGAPRQVLTLEELEERDLLPEADEEEAEF